MIWDDAFQHENKRFDVDGCGAAPANPTQEAERNWAVLTPYVEAELVASNDSSHKLPMMKPDSHVQSWQIAEQQNLNPIPCMKIDPTKKNAFLLKFTTAYHISPRTTGGQPVQL